MKEGYLELSENHEVRGRIAPATLPEFKHGIGYFSYGKYEPESTACRFVAMLRAEGATEWMAMSLRRIFYGVQDDSTLNKLLSYLRITTSMSSYPKTIPVLTEYQKEEPGFGLYATYSGLLYLQNFGVIEIRRVGDEDYIFPTKKLIDDLERGLKFAAELEARWAAQE